MMDRLLWVLALPFKIIRRLWRILHYGHAATREMFVAHWRKKGMRIGNGTVIFEPTNVFLDPSRPYMIEIGENVQITRGVTIVTHDYSWSVFKGKYGDILGSCGRVTIGNNCFIGMNAIILKDVTIGDDCIIGAGSVVRKDVPAGSVVAGNPAKVITTVQEFYTSRIDKQFEEAKAQVLNYYAVYQQVPPPQELHEFFWLFEERPTGTLKEKVFHKKMCLLENEERSYARFMEQKPMFDSYEKFIKACLFSK